MLKSHLSKKHLLQAAISGLGCIAAILSGCVTPPPAEPISPVTISEKIPDIIAMPESPESQDKGGVVIAMVPATYGIERRDAYTVTEAPATLGSLLGTLSAPSSTEEPNVYALEGAEPRAVVAPDRLVFSVRVNNQLDRVFRGQGAVVQFNVAGKLIPFGATTDYAEFLNGIVPPRNETTFTIRGPFLKDVPDECVIGIFLYDVVTGTDVAGNVTERQNYTWYFKYSKHDASMTVMPAKPIQTTMTAAEFRAAQERARREAL